MAGLLVSLDVHGGAKTLVPTCYDRARSQDGMWLRLHQEDLLQAMSYPPTKKYQSDGGPSVKNVASLLSTLALADRDAVRSAFYDAVAFNGLVGGTDAHRRTTPCSCAGHGWPWHPSTTSRPMRPT